jgi:amino acid adenylation domain-containing protein
MSHHAPTSPSVRSLFTPEDIDQSIAARFECQAVQSADRMAVDGPHGTLTYGELNRSANCIAHRLLSLDAASHRTVALLVDQGAPFAAAIIGALKAGYCFVPLDPTYPAERNGFMLTDSAAGVLLTNRRHLATAVQLAPPGVAIVDIDELKDAAAEPPHRTDPDQAAYILYTSGSTGTPKGVVHSHRTVLHNAWRHHDVLQHGPDDRQSLLYPCSVYGGLRDIFNALLNGASLHHYDVRERGTASLADWLVEHRVTIYCSVVTIFRHFARGLSDGQCFPDVRAVKLGGEAPGAQDVELFRSHFDPSTVLHCGLGSTETGMTLHFSVTRETTIDGPAIPLGEPVRDVKVLLLDETGEAVAEGEIGEIVIESPYVAVGYFNRPDLCGRVFRGEAGRTGRRFFTGDLGRKGPGGLFEHQGRRDRQVKIRGNRIEPREIELALESLDEVRDAAVVAHQDAAAGPRLTAWYVPARRPAPPASELRRLLRSRLSGHLIPTDLLELDQLPLLPNGKVDRQALVKMDAAGSRRSEPGPMAPRTATERALMTIWGRLLPTPPDSITADFFALGGHSLIAIQMTTECERQFGVRLPLATLLDHSTVEDLAALIDRRGARPAFSPLVPLKPDGSKRPFFCVHGIGGEALFLKPLAKHIDPDQPFYALQADPTADGIPLDRLVESMAARYLDAIRSIQPAGPYLIGGYSFGGTVALEMAQQIRARGEEVGMLVMFDHSPFRTPHRHPASAAGRMAGIVRNLPHWITDDLLRTPVRRMAVRAKGRIVEIVRRAAGGATQPSVEAYFGVRQVPEQTFGFFNAHHGASRSYKPRPYDGPVTVFRSRCEPLLRPRTSDLGWSQIAGGGVDVHRLPGSHANLLREPFVQALARRLSECLADHSLRPR